MLGLIPRLPVGHIRSRSLAKARTAPTASSFPQTVTYSALSATDPQPNDYKWQTAWRTAGDKMLLWGTGDHNFWYGLAGNQTIGVIRVFDPATETMSNPHYPAGDTDAGNTTTGHGNPVSNNDNLNYLYIPELNSLWIPSYGAYDLDVTGSSPYWGWSHGNSESGTGTPNNAASWPSGPYWDDLVTNYSVAAARKNSFLAFCDAQSIGILLGNGYSTNQDAICRVIYKSGAQWTCKEVTITNWSPASFNRGCIAVVGDYAYFGGGKTAAEASTLKFWRLDLANVASKSNGGSTDASALTALADLPVATGDAPGSAGWPQLTHDAAHGVLVLALPAAVYLYDIATDQWSTDRAPGGYSMGTGYVHGIYSTGQSAHYYRPDGTTGTIKKLVLS